MIRPLLRDKMIISDVWYKLVSDESYWVLQELLWRVFLWCKLFINHNVNNATKLDSCMNSGLAN